MLMSYKCHRMKYNVFSNNAFRYPISRNTATLSGYTDSLKKMEWIE